MAEQPERGAAEDAAGVPLTPTEAEASRRPPSEPRADDARREGSRQDGQREAEQAHGGSMAPGLVDETGHPVAEPPPSRPAADDA